jgi:hypothetical protein
MQEEILAAIRGSPRVPFGRPVSAEDAEQIMLLRSQETARKAAWAAGFDSLLDGVFANTVT